MVDEEKFFTVKPKGTPRGIAIADYGRDKVVLRDDLSAAELAVYAEKNAALAFWLPANCSAQIFVEKTEKNAQGTFYSFSYQVEASSALYSEKAATSAADVEFPWLIYCGGEWVVKSCPLGQIATCNAGVPGCDPLL